ncbi:MAG TPA: DnaJ C-terminal domain-containing protein [Ktedonobacteraceae bacterium]|jgi:hypothetical protein
MAFYDSPPEDIRATLAISQDEARLGGSRVINLPGGRTTTVTVPAGTRDGDELRLPGQGQMPAGGGNAGALVLRVSVIAANPAHPDPEDLSITQSVPMPPPDYAADPAIYQQTSPAQPYGRPASYPYYPAYGQAYTPPPYTPQPTPQPPPRRRTGVLTVLLLLIVLAVLLGSGLFFYFGYYQPHQAQVAGTATAQAYAQATVNAQASSTAQVVQATAQAGATATARAQATAQAYQDIYTRATQNAPVLNEPLNGQTASQWDETSSSNGTCRFSAGSYHSFIPTAGFFQPCYAENTSFSNFAFQVDMLIKQGDEGGIIFRADNVSDKFYLFRIDTNGNYSLYQYKDNQGAHAVRLMGGTTGALAGPGQSIQLTLVARNSNLAFYVNQHYLDGVSDGTYSSGKIGVFGESATRPTDVAFTSARVWAL